MAARKSAKASARKKVSGSPKKPTAPKANAPISAWEKYDKDMDAFLARERKIKSIKERVKKGEQALRAVGAAPKRKPAAPKRKTRR